MAITVADGLGSRSPGARVPGSRRENTVKVTFDTSYPTGGYTVTAAQCGLNSIDSVDAGCTALGRIAAWDQTNSKIKLFSAVTTEVANTTDVSADSILLSVAGL